MTLEQIKKWAENIQGSWDGDNPGSAEERAGQAEEILEKVAELEELIDGMDNL